VGKGHIKEPKVLNCVTCKVEFLGKHYMSKYCCKECKVKDPEFIARLPTLNKSSTLLRLYGITIDDYASLVESQESKCAICNETPKTLYVDHNHETGKVRGLLCMKCNAGLGLFKDKQSNLQNAVAYLQKNELKKVRG